MVWGLASLFLIGILAACNALGAVTPTPADGITVIDPPITLATDLTLTDQTRAPFQLAALKGKLVLVNFGYTHCPDICPINLAVFRGVKQLLGADAARTAFVFISVDGARDTPLVLASYLKQFDPAFIGLTASDAVLHQLGTPFGLAFWSDTPEPGHTDYAVTHTAASYLLDGQGRLRRIYGYQTTAEVITADMRSVLTAG
jgi:protein SCO1/2